MSQNSLTNKSNNIRQQVIELLSEALTQFSSSIDDQEILEQLEDLDIKNERHNRIFSHGRRRTLTGA